MRLVQIAAVRCCLTLEEGADAEYPVLDSSQIGILVAGIAGCVGRDFDACAGDGVLSLAVPVVELGKDLFAAVLAFPLPAKEGRFGMGLEVQLMIETRGLLSSGV